MPLLEMNLLRTSVVELISLLAVDVVGSDSVIYPNQISSLILFL
jgi:hypothetical protein